jgi:hypothetical protein
MDWLASMPAAMQPPIRAQSALFPPCLAQRGITMQEQTAYTVIHRRLVAGEEPTFTEIIDLLKVDTVAAAVFQAGSRATIIYLLQRCSSIGNHTNEPPPGDW